MGRLERDLKKKIRNTKKDYSEWYSEHEQQILQGVAENESYVDLGNVKAKKRIPVKVWILFGAALLLIAIITVSVVLSRYKNQSPVIPDFTFGAESVSDELMNDKEVGEVVAMYPQLANMVIGRGYKSIYLKDNSVVMNTINGEIETNYDFYVIEVRIAYTDNFVFFDKWEFEDLKNQTIIDGTEIDYEDKGTDDYGMYLYYAVTQEKGATIYWKVSCIEGLFDEWMQITFG